MAITAIHVLKCLNIPDILHQHKNYRFNSGASEEKYHTPTGTMSA